MKKLFTLLALIVITTITAQAPQGFNYQATVRNSAGALIINQNVLFKFNIMLNSQTSLPVYSETHQVPTDDLGQVNLTVGTGTATTGTFTGINWGAGNYYLGIELNTGSGYVAMGTTQLLSVPYALYANSAGSTQSQGKTSIYLTGNITNAQAAAKIAAEFGPYTENIYIKNTTQLTSVDLSALVTISNIEIYNNSNLTSINLNNLTTIEDEFNLEQSSAINSLSFPNLLNCSSIQINSITISSLNVPLLSSINNFYLGSSFYSDTNNTMTSLNFPSVQSIGGYFNLTGLDSLTSLTLPVLHTLSGNISLFGSNSQMGSNYLTNLTTISFPALTSCTDFYCNSMQGSNTSGSGSIYIGSYNENSSINLSSLNTCNSINIGGGANLNLSNLMSCQSLNVNGISNFTPPSNLTSCNYLSINNMSNLTALSFPSLSSCDSIYVGVNPLLTSVSFPALTSSFGISLSNNALPTSKINSLLNKFLTVSPTVQKNIDLSGQNPLAPPTGQGLIDKQTLINTGNSVITD
jgi:hypothetical protein